MKLAPILSAGLALVVTACGSDIWGDSKGDSYDNALAESFNGALKVERVHRTVYPTRRKAQEDIARYIELRYNRKRLHSAIGYRTPQEAMDEHREMKAAA